jgi:arylsulfatase A-like enzyme
MNVLFLVVDSLRARSLDARQEGRPATPFLERFAGEAVRFRRAFATECWTLPTHTSMFTGLLPSQHRAHFQHLGYEEPAPTLAERLARAGYHTEVVTRNSVLDGTLPGATRGFAQHVRHLSPRGNASNPMGLFLALSKPRFRRQIRESGFFHALQRDNRAFAMTFARATLPADGLSLGYLLERMDELRKADRRWLLFCNLYDVHAPYAPSLDSMFRPLDSLDALRENLRAPLVLQYLGAHAYLRPGFRLSDASRRMLLARYHRAIELMDAKLAAFFEAADAQRLLDDALVVLVSDHGEAFGDHGLYLHDASVHDVHLHVPLFLRHPELAPAVVDDVVSTRDLFGTVAALALGGSTNGTLLDRDARAARPVALAEHFHSPHVEHMAPRFIQNLAAARIGDRKAIVRREGTFLYDMARDPDERAPEESSVEEFAIACRKDGHAPDAIAEAVAHLRRAAAPR